MKRMIAAIGIVLALTVMIPSADASPDIDRLSVREWQLTYSIDGTILACIVIEIDPDFTFVVDKDYMNGAFAITIHSNKHDVEGLLFYNSSNSQGTYIIDSINESYGHLSFYDLAYDAHIIVDSSCCDNIDHDNGSIPEFGYAGTLEKKDDTSSTILAAVGVAISALVIIYCYMTVRRLDAYRLNNLSL